MEQHENMRQFVKAYQSAPYMLKIERERRRRNSEKLFKSIYEESRQLHDTIYINVFTPEGQEISLMNHKCLHTEEKEEYTRLADSSSSLEDSAMGENYSPLPSAPSSPLQRNLARHKQINKQMMNSMSKLFSQVSDILDRSPKRFTKKTHQSTPPSPDTVYSFPQFGRVTNKRKGMDPTRTKERFLSLH